jgi:hypothetical protein
MGTRNRDFGGLRRAYVVQPVQLQTKRTNVAELARGVIKLVCGAGELERSQQQHSKNHDGFCAQCLYSSSFLGCQHSFTFIGAYDRYIKNKVHIAVSPLG